MIVTNRQRRLLEALLVRDGEMTAGRLAEEAGISARTVHRELRELEPLLAGYGLALVKKSGVGISLEGDDVQLDQFRDDLRHSGTETYSPDERKVLMLCRLLEEEEPVKLFALAREAQAAIPTVSRDLDELEPDLTRSGIALVRRRGFGVQIAGDEADKRDFIVSLAERYLDPSDWFGSARESAEPWSVTRRLLELAGREAFLQVEQTLWQQAEEWLQSLKESDYTRLLVRLTVAVSRIRKGRSIAPAKGEASPETRPHVSGKLLQAAEALGLRLSGEEAQYLQRLFDQARERASDVSTVILEKYGLELAEQTVALIRAVEGRLDLPLGKDRSLLDGLLRHLGPALERLRNGERIRNPLLPQIRKDNEALFLIVKRSAAEIWHNIEMPDEEAGYLTLHFGAALERWKLAPPHVRTLLVCTSGIGSSKLLAVRITKEIPQIDLVGHYSWYEASRMPEDQYDLIVSTVDLPVDPERYIKLSPLLTREETEKLKARIRRLTPPPQPQGVPEGADDAWERFKRMSDYAAETVDLLEPFRVYDWDYGAYGSGSRGLLASMLNALEPGGRIEDPDLIVRQLLERERQGSLLIPETELALYHTRSEAVRRPVLALFRLRHPLPMPHEAGGRAKHILLMLAPLALNRRTLELLSEISAMLLLPETVRLLEREEESAIRAHFSRGLESYIKTKMDGREPA